jgi:hypothetical protein
MWIGQNDRQITDAPLPLVVALVLPSAGHSSAARVGMCGMREGKVSEQTTEREPRCQHGKHIVLDPPCQECVKEVEAFRKRCYDLDDARAK